MAPKSITNEIKLLCFVGFYITANFIAPLMPLLLYGAILRDNTSCQVILALSILDFVIPLYPGPRGKSQPFIRFSSCKDGLVSYFHAEIISECDFDPQKNYSVCYFPHSLFAIVYPLILEFLETKHGISLLFSVADIIFKIPIVRRFMTAWGATCVSESALKTNLKLPSPHNVMMVQPDGIAGMFYGLRHEQIVLAKRKGFVRVALQTGSYLVPCYTFGANDFFHRKFGGDSVAAKVSSKIRMSCVFWTDRFGIPFGIVPNKTKLVVVLGPAIGSGVPVDKPTQAQIDVVHAEFVIGMKKLYDRHKHRMGKKWVEKHEKLYLESEQPVAIK
mmetsp:Transcript_55649/g.65033  ORF Transcript_55649/g.65033 Transcript_55649/m.65033 type:complete len:331 (-) Transcript_55649:19-1011(-)